MEPTKNKIAKIRKGMEAKNFGCGNLIIAGLGASTLKSNEGINGIINCMECQTL